MSRSLWKGPFVDFSLIRISHKLRQNVFETYRSDRPSVNLVSAKPKNNKLIKTSEQIDPRQQNQPIRDTVISKAGAVICIPIKIWSRRSIILPEFLSQQFEIHNGKDFISLQVNEEMIGHKFGEFSSTRKKTIHKKKLTKK